MRCSLLFAAAAFALTTAGCALPVAQPPAEPHVPMKSDGSVTNRYWKLVELAGKAVPPLQREPHFILHLQDQRVSGSDGCNRLMGTYTLDAARSRLSFGPLAATRMACVEGADIARGFTTALEQADGFALDGDRLSLHRARMAPLARFEAVYLR